MAKFIFLLIVHSELLSSLTSCNIPTKQRQTYDTLQYAIIKYKNDGIFKNEKATVLLKKEVLQIQNLLRTAVEKYNKESTNMSFKIRPLKYYKIKLVPFINSKGEKEVWVNCLCNTEGSQWKNEIILVSDGGNCYFNIKINLSSKTYYQLAVNGYA